MRIISNQRRLVRATVGLLAIFTAKAVRGEEVSSEKSAPMEVTIIEHLFADRVEFSPEGRCLAGGKKSIRSWQVPGFPAAIPHFESCTTLQAKNLRGEVEFSMIIIDGAGKRLQKIQGVMLLNEEGKTSQAAEWDHLQIPSAGTYYLVISVAGNEVKKIPMLFTKKKISKSKSRKS